MLFVCRGTEIGCKLQASGDVQRICEQQLQSSEIDAALRERYARDCVGDLKGEFTGQQLVFWQRATQMKIVTIEVDGDYARASLRSGTCTLYAWEAGFDRLEDGGWVYDQAHESWGDAPTCRERDGIFVRGDPRVPWLQSASEIVDKHHFGCGGVVSAFALGRSGLRARAG